MNNEVIRLHVSWRQQRTIEVYQDPEKPLTNEEVEAYLLELHDRTRILLAMAGEGDEGDGTLQAFCEDSDFSCFPLPRNGEGEEPDYDEGIFGVEVEWMFDNASHHVHIPIHPFAEQEPERAIREASDLLIERGGEREQILTEVQTALALHPEALAIVAAIVEKRQKADNEKYKNTYFKEGK